MQTEPKITTTENEGFTVVQAPALDPSIPVTSGFSQVIERQNDPVCPVDPAEAALCDSCQ